MELFTVAVATLLCSVVFLYLYLSRSYNYWSNRGVPSLRGTFPFGNIKEIFFMKKAMAQFYQEIYRKFEGEPVCGFYKMLRPVFMVRHPELVRTVLQKEFINFEENDFHFNTSVDPILSGNPFALTGERWKQQRGTLVKTQNPAKLKAMYPLVAGICQPLIDHLNKNAMKPLEAKYLGGNFTADAVASCVFGHPTNSFENPNSEFRRMSNKIINGEFFSNIALVLGFYAPTLLKIFPFRMIGKDVQDYFCKVLKDIIDERMTGNKSRNDFLQQFVNENREAIDKGLPPVYSYDQIVIHCLNFYMDGYNTSSVAICFALYELAKNPESQQKAREEILSYASHYSDLDYDVLLKLDYLHAVLTESMRLHPPVGMMTRVCTRSTTISIAPDKKWTIEKGTPVTMPVYALHMDPEIYKDPKAFKPERFLSGSSTDNSSLHRYAYLPFGEGPRICPGMKFAQMQVKLCLATILQNFEILPSSALTDDEGLIVMDPASSFMYAAKNGVWVMFKPLSAN